MDQFPTGSVLVCDKCRGVAYRLTRPVQSSDPIRPDDVVRGDGRRVEDADQIACYACGAELGQREGLISLLESPPPITRS